MNLHANAALSLNKRRLRRDTRHGALDCLGGPVEDRDGQAQPLGLERAVRYERERFEIEQLLTDNGSAYVSVAHALACRALGIRHIRTRPYRPQTTARQRASSAQCSAAGPTQRPTATAQSAPQPLTKALALQPSTKTLNPSHKPPIAHLNERTNLLSIYAWDGRSRSVTGTDMNSSFPSRGYPSSRTILFPYLALNTL